MDEQYSIVGNNNGVTTDTKEQVSIKATEVILSPKIASLWKTAKSDCLGVLHGTEGRKNAATKRLGLGSG